MYCPKCRVEYREGFARCSDCDMALVNDLPPEPEPEYVEMVTVFEGDSNSAATARARLESAGIRAWDKDEGIHSVFPSVGASEIQVRTEDEDLALEVLKEEDDPL